MRFYLTLAHRAVSPSTMDPWVRLAFSASAHTRPAAVCTRFLGHPPSPFAQTWAFAAAANPPSASVARAAIWASAATCPKVSAGHVRSRRMSAAENRPLTDNAGFYACSKSLKIRSLNLSSVLPVRGVDGRHDRIRMPFTRVTAINITKSHQEPKNSCVSLSSLSGMFRGRLFKSWYKSSENFHVAENST